MKIQSIVVRHTRLIGMTAVLFMIGTSSLAQAPTLLVSGSNEFRHIQDFEPDPTIEGNYRLLSEPTTVALYLDGTPDPYNISGANINLLDFSVLLSYESSTVFIEPKYVDSVRMTQSILINSKHLSSTTTPDRLLLLIKEVGSMTLFKEQKMELLPPTWNKSLQVGNKNYTLQSSTTYYLLDGGGDLLGISKSLKEFKKRSYFATLKKRVKADGINFKEEADNIRFAEIVAELNP